MSSFSTKRAITMDRAAKKIIKTSLKIVNLILCIFGITILMFSLWMIIVVLNNYRKYFFSSWFLWTTIGFGIMFCFISFIGYVGARTRGTKLLSIYIVSITLLLLVEIIVLGDVLLNDKWEKDFPKDPAKRFEDFVDYVENHSSTFKSLTFLIFLLQMSGFGLAMALRVIREFSRSYLDNDANQVSAGLSFLAHQVGQGNPYVLGHPIHAAHHSNVKDQVKDFIPSGEKDAWVMSTHGCPPPYYA